MPTQTQATASSPEQIRAKLLTPRTLKTHEIRIEHPEGDEVVVANQLPWPNLKQYKTDVQAQPERADELLVIHSLTTLAGDTVLTLADVTAFDEMEGMLADELISKCQMVNGK